MNAMRLSVSLASFVTGPAQDYAAAQLLGDKQALWDACVNEQSDGALLDKLAKSGNKTALNLVAANLGASQETLEWVVKNRRGKAKEVAQAQLDQRAKNQERRAKDYDGKLAGALKEFLHAVEAEKARAIEQKAGKLMEAFCSADPKSADWEDTAEYFQKAGIEALDLLAAFGACGAALGNEDFAVREEALAALATSYCRALAGAVMWGEAFADEFKDPKFKAKLAEVAQAARNLKLSGHAAMARACFDPDTTTSELASIVKKLNAAQREAEACGTLAYLHPNISLEAQKSIMRKGLLVSGYLKQGKFYGQEAHGHIVLAGAKLGEAHTFELLQDDSCKWDELLGRQEVATALFEAVDSCYWVAGDTTVKCEKYADNKVLAQMVRNSGEGLVCWALERSPSEEVRVGVSFNTRVIGVFPAYALTDYHSADIWSDTKNTDNLSMKSLIEAMKENYPSDSLKSSIDKALRKIGEAVGGDLVSMVAVDGLAGGFTGSVAEFACLAKEMQKTKKTNSPGQADES